jgi:hypothetical protein
MPVDLLIRRFLLCIAIASATGAATWVDPPAAESPPPTVLRGPRIEAAPPSKTVTAGQGAGKSVPLAGVSVARWEFGPTAPGRPVYLTMTLAGTQTAIDRMQAGQPLTIQVHWTRESAGTTSGAPNLVTDLAIGRPGLAAVFDGDVRRRGYFEWHTWARKDYLSPGPWTVSVTYPDGQPLPCGPDAQPCRFTLNVG